jgi:two-component system response regulator PhoP
LPAPKPSSAAAKAHPTLTVLGLTVNTLEQTVVRNGVFVDLSPTEYRVLEYLIHRPRVIVSKRELLEHLYDYNWEHHSNVIEVHVSNLRKKLDAVLPDSDPIIETMRGRGYRLAPSLPMNPDPAADPILEQGQ